MKVFLLRHAAAEYGGPDPDRPLSVAGKQVAHKLAQFVKSKSYYSFSEIWSSPYLRARQTADPFIQLSSNTASVSIKDSLVPGANPEHIMAEIKESGGSLLVVGHNPHLSMLAASLLELEHGWYPLSFKKGAIFVFKRDPFSGSGFTLSAYLPPSALGLKD